MSRLGLAVVFSAVAACSSAAAPLPPAPAPVDGFPALDGPFEDIYVSPERGGDRKENGDGSRERPYRTFLVAYLNRLPKKTDLPLRILVCGREAEGYLYVIEGGLTVTGGLDCATWTPTGGRTRFVVSAPTISGPQATIHVRGRPGEVGVVLDHVEADALYVREASLRLRHVRIAAPAGAPVPPQPLSTAERGSSAAGSPSGGTRYCSPTSQGGRAPGGAGVPRAPTAPSNGGIDGAACDAGGSGTSGADGEPGRDAPAMDAFDQYGSDFRAPSGKAGQRGTPGQGGGGGAGRRGGGGGAGGCSVEALGGFGGAASVAIFAHDARLVLDESEVVTGGGGDGADGTPPIPGGEGDRGGDVGPPSASMPDLACPGGSGGRGGASGASGGGAGGLSVGIVYTGTAPVFDAATSAAMNLGPPGKGGRGGAAHNAGLDGLRAPMLRCAALDYQRWLCR